MNTPSKWKVELDEIPWSIEWKIRWMVKQSNMAVAITSMIKYFFTEINKSFSTSFELFDELIMYKIDPIDKEIKWIPYFIHSSWNKRKIAHFSQYQKDAISIMDNYQRNKSKYQVNTVISIDDAYWTSFDAMIILRSWYIIFFNNKKYSLSDMKDRWDLDVAKQKMSWLIRVLNWYFLAMEQWDTQDVLLFPSKPVNKDIKTCSIEPQWETPTTTQITDWEKTQKIDIPKKVIEKKADDIRYLLSLDDIDKAFDTIFEYWLGIINKKYNDTFLDEIVIFRKWDYCKPVYAYHVWEWRSLENPEILKSDAWPVIQEYIRQQDKISYHQLVTLPNAKFTVFDIVVFMKYWDLIVFLNNRDKSLNELRYGNMILYEEAFRSITHMIQFLRDYLLCYQKRLSVK